VHVLHDVELVSVPYSSMKRPQRNLNYDKWFNPKKLKEMWSTIYKIIEYAMTTKWKKELPNKNEEM